MQLPCSTVPWVKALACVTNHRNNLVHDAPPSYLQVQQLFLTLYSNTQCTHVFKRLFKLFVYFMCMGVLPACLSVLRVCAMPMEAKRGSEMSWRWS